jgi:hypothetical protein
MNKLRMIPFLLLTLLCNYSFAKENLQTNPQIKISSKNSSLTVSCHSVDKEYAENYLGDYGNNAYLKVKEVRNEGRILALDDGSEWDIKYFGGGWRLLGWGWMEQREVSHWEEGDRIEVQYPGSGNFIDFIMVITNLSKNEKACVTLHQAPSVNDANCLWVYEFDKEKNRVSLSDGTVWYKTKTDMYGALIHKQSPVQTSWTLGDTITLVRAEGWLNSNSYMLWNHTTNEMPYSNRVE